MCTYHVYNVSIEKIHDNGLKKLLYDVHLQMHGVSVQST